MRPVALLLLCSLMLVLAIGAGAQPPAAKNKPDAKKTDPKAKKSEEEPEAGLNMKLKLAEIRMGKTILGPKLERDDLKGKVVLVDYWGINCGPCLAAMPHTARLYAELAPFGFEVLGSHVQEGNEEDVRAVALKHGANFPISIQTRVPGSEDNRFLPHVMLFDHTGECIFRGHPKDIESPVRKAVGAAIVAQAGREKFSPTLAPIVKDLKDGKSPAQVLPKVSAMRNFKGDAGADANGLLGVMTAAGRKKLEEAQASSDPVEAFLLAETLPVAYKGSNLATEANELLAKLRKEKAVTTELTARQYFEKQIKKFDQMLGMGAQDPAREEFKKNNAASLKQLKARVEEMKRQWPEAKITQDAIAMAERYLIELK